ncbi:hypothetical protein N7471_003843 [Penicillium samsonianum]|uniref:uncharacterized protein n=1 Tax=Penicillium samsonianum TaxID=1882272 RepID=UPI002548F892|nr:uncharacterized protein N7471_003843 [Penicillium samsonianum]KAJ6137357.1 hypothetical protein N7471_003843 [Penicillium samsonianum]
MTDLDLRYGQWYEMARRTRPQQRPTQPQPVRYQGQQFPRNPQYSGARYTYGRGNPVQGYQLPFRPRHTGTDAPQLTWNPNRDPQRQQQFQRSAYLPPSNASQTQAQRASYAPPQQQVQGSYQQRQQQPPRDQARTNQAGQLLLSDKPWNQAGYSSPGYAARQPRTRPTAAYQADPQEVAPPTAPQEANLADVPPEANLANSY